MPHLEHLGVGAEAQKLLNPKPLNAKPQKLKPFASQTYLNIPYNAGSSKLSGRENNPKPQNLKAETLEVSGQEPKRMSAAKCLGVSREIPEVFQGDSTGGLTSLPRPFDVAFSFGELTCFPEPPKYVEYSPSRGFGPLLYLPWGGFRFRLW